MCDVVIHSVTIGASYHMSPAIFGKITPETCYQIWNVLLFECSY